MISMWELVPFGMLVAVLVISLGAAMWISLNDDDGGAA